MITVLLVFTLLIIATYYDCRYKMIPWQLNLTFGVLGLLMNKWQGVIGCLACVGVVSLIIVFYEVLLKKEVIGGGDMKLFGALGALLGIQLSLLLLGWSFIMAGLIMQLTDKKNIPFAPSVLGTFIIIMLGGI